jgi:hypothetical protein
MTRGIHLKHLTGTDLGLLGLQKGLVPGDGRETAPPGPHSLLREADPALAKVIDELRDGLQGTLELLEQALGPPKNAEAPEAND